MQAWEGGGSQKGIPASGGPGGRPGRGAAADGLRGAGPQGEWRGGRPRTSGAAVRAALRPGTGPADAEPPVASPPLRDGGGPSGAADLTGEGAESPPGASGAEAAVWGVAPGPAPLRHAPPGDGVRSGYRRGARSRRRSRPPWPAGRPPVGSAMGCGPASGRRASDQRGGGRGGGRGADRGTGHPLGPAQTAGKPASTKKGPASGALKGVGSSGGS